MERHEIEAELDEVERDLAYIARRAQIAAENLRSVAEFDSRIPHLAYADDIKNIALNAERTRTLISHAREVARDMFGGAKPSPAAAGEGGAG